MSLLDPCKCSPERIETMSYRDSTRVYVGDLGSGGSKPELEREFERYGPLKSVWVARNPPGTFLCRGSFISLLVDRSGEGNS